MKSKIFSYNLSAFFFSFFLLMTLFQPLAIATTPTEDGTKAHPFQISSPSELLEFANAVNNGNSYENQYVLQTCDIDLSGIDWPTIGLFDSDCFFNGTYDGGGHTISNLSVTVGGNNSFFGQLGGTVMNLGIESGFISGTCVGSITSHASRSTAVIINCYNKATVEGARAGGIADNFNGTISNCWSSCDLISDSIDSIGGIVSYGASSLANCISFEPSGRSGVTPSGVQFTDTAKADLSKIVTALNQSLYDSASLSGIDYHDLYFWSVSADGQSIEYSSEKAHFVLSYASAFFKAKASVFIPYILIFFGLSVLSIILLKAHPKE